MFQDKHVIKCVSRDIEKTFYVRYDFLQVLFLFPTESILDT